MNYLRQSTAATAKFGPFVNDTDYKTPETGLTIQKADVRISKNGGDYAAADADQGASDVGAPHDEGGEYDIAFSTTDTNTTGTLKVRISVAGALPVWRMFQVLTAAVYDALHHASDGNIRADLIDAPNATAISAIQSGLATQSSVNDNSLLIAAGTIGDTGNDTTHLHLVNLGTIIGAGDDELNGYMIVVEQDAGAISHARWITDWNATTDVATLHDALPQSPTNDVDTYRVFAIRRDMEATNAVLISEGTGVGQLPASLRISAMAVRTGTVQAAEGSANSATVFDTDLPLENANYYGDADGGLVIAFVSGTTNQYQTRRIVASVTGTLNTRITLDESLDDTPTDADAFVVLGKW